MRDYYRIVMDSELNPLRNLHYAERFQLMVFLSVMWTTIFCASAGAWFWYGELIVGHLLVAGGVLVTSYVFAQAERSSGSVSLPKTYRDFPASDRTARYDDVWGA